MSNKKKGNLIAFSAPSGTGKSTICNLLLEKHKNLVLSISATTRSPRAGEKHGQSYFFLTRQQFQESIENGEMLEWEEVHGNFYGTLKFLVREETMDGNNVLLDIDVKGALELKKIYPDTVMIFIKPPSLEELRRRLESRGTETKDQIDMRLSRIALEYEKAKEFDYIVINDTLADTISEIESIIELK